MRIILISLITIFKSSQLMSEHEKGQGLIRCLAFGGLPIYLMGRANPWICLMFCMAGTAAVLWRAACPKLPKTRRLDS